MRERAIRVSEQNIIESSALNLSTVVQIDPSWIGSIDVNNCVSRHVLTLDLSEVDHRGLITRAVIRSQSRVLAASAVVLEVSEHCVVDP